METRSRLLRRSWLLGAFAALLLTGACAELQDAFGGEESTPAPEATAVPDATAGEAAGSAAALEPTADAELAMRYIGNTGGVGVSLRSACAADARSPGGWPEATEVRLLDSDEAGCEGWSLAEAGGATSWVSELYLVQERPAGATIGSSAPAPPAGAASGAGGNAAAAAATPPPAAAGSAMSGAAPMIVYGPAAAGASVLILIDGRPCKTVEAVEAVERHGAVVVDAGPRRRVRRARWLRDHLRARGRAHERAAGVVRGRRAAQRRDRRLAHPPLAHASSPASAERAQPRPRVVLSAHQRAGRARAATEGGERWSRPGRCG